MIPTSPGWWYLNGFPALVLYGESGGMPGQVLGTRTNYPKYGNVCPVTVYGPLWGGPVPTQEEARRGPLVWIPAPQEDTWVCGNAFVGPCGDGSGGQAWGLFLNSPWGTARSIHDTKEEAMKAVTSLPGFQIA